MSVTTVMPSLIGTFFSNLKRIEYNNDTLIVHYKYGLARSYSLSNCTGFACLEIGLLSSKIIFADTNKVEIGYLDKYKAKVLFDVIEKRLATVLTTKLNHAKTLLKAVAFDDFLRDSSIESLNTVWALVENYRINPEAWHKYHSAEQLSILNKLTIFSTIETLVAGLRANYEQTTLIARGNFYDNIEANPLTMEQRLAVIRDNDINLVLAAAGTGKTSVMVAKALDLIDRKLAKPEQILILAYNKEAASELKNRYKSRCITTNNAMPTIMTFHSLGRLILTQCDMPIRLSDLVDSSIKQQWLSNWLAEQICYDRDFLNLFVKLLYQPVNVFDFRGKQAYQDYLTSNQYHSLSGYHVASYQELLIANWLYLHGIKHQYNGGNNTRYKTVDKLNKGKVHQASFYLNDANMYIEYFIIDRHGNTPIFLDRAQYYNEMQVIKSLYKEDKNLIEIYHYDWLAGHLEQKLCAATKDAKITRYALTPAKVLNKLVKYNFMKTCSVKYLKCLEAMRVEQMDDIDLNERLKTQAIIHSNDYKTLLTRVQTGYVSELEKQQAIDFDDMIIKSVKALSSGKFTPRWSHILVDEFQDISASRFEFLQQLISQGSNVRLTAVGDDWQSIYRFSGGKLELTTRFNELVGNHSLSMLQKTFRYNNSIADVAGRFVMQNPEQYKKQVTTHTQVHSAQVVLLDDLYQGQQSLPLKVQHVLSTIEKTDATASIAVIARYRAQLTKVQDGLTVQIKNPINFWTYHGAKGLEADYCILIGFEQGKWGFPSDQKGELLVESLLPRLDDFPNSEERRLFYVGLTRAKHKAFIIANPDENSVFIRELIDNNYEIQLASPLFSSTRH